MPITFTDIKHTRGEVLRLRPSDIIRDEKNRGRPFGVTEDAIAAMAHSLEHEGQKQPVVIRKVDGKPHLTAGFTRHSAALRIEQRDPAFRLSCVLEAADDEHAAFRSALVENATRNDLSVMEHALNIDEATRRGIFASDAEVATFYGKDRSWVSRVRKLLLLPADIQARVHSGDISFHAARHLADLPPDVQSHHIATGTLTVGDIEESLRHAPAPLTAKELAPALAEVAPEQPAAPPKRKMQRNLSQVKRLLGNYVDQDTNVVLRTFSTSLMAYITGEHDEVAFELLVCELEGKPGKLACPVKVRA